jgi:hypothetical protein
MAKNAKNKAIEKKTGKTDKPAFYAKKYQKGKKPSAKSEYFGKSFKQLRHEADNANK